MRARVFSLAIVGALAALIAPADAQYQMQVYGLWHCYSDACSWASVPNMTTFDTDNHWIIDRNMDNTFHPSVNVVVLSFVDPVKLMNLTNDSSTVNGIPIGMNTSVINYFQSRGIRVMMSIGGFSFISHWDKALKANPTKLGINAANAAKQFNVGMEIDYEKSSNPDVTHLQNFVSAYRSVVPYDSTGSNFAARLTIDLGNDDLFLTALANYATTHWLTTSSPVLDYANAMVASENTVVSTLETGWQQHVQGTSSVPPLAPAKLTGSLWVVGNNPIPNCIGPFSNSDQETAFNFVSTIPASGAGTSSGMLGYMFWGGGCQGNGTVCTYPPNTCQAGVGAGGTTFNIPTGTFALRQQ
jgi:hypothetical protein